MEDIQEIFMYVPPIGGRAHGPYHIHLTAQGEADISNVPERYKQDWQKFGVRLPIGSGSRLFPKDGAAFLQALLSTPSNGYTPWFKTDNDKNV